VIDGALAISNNQATQIPMAEARSILFDLDGTLIDSAPAAGAALNGVLADEGLETLSAEKFQGLLGGGLAWMMENALKIYGETADDERMQRLCGRFVDHYVNDIALHTVVYPGVVEALEILRLRGIGLGICTNKPASTGLPSLRELDLERYFDAISYGDSYAFKKPDPRHVTATLDQMGCDKSGAVFVGDSKWDIAAARNAGIPVIAVSYGYSGEDLGALAPDAIIDGFDNFIGIWETISN
jgi:phosphoglycolate phosphatase